MFHEEAKFVSGLVGDDLWKNYHLLDSVSPLKKDDLADMYLNVNWRASLTVTGVDGLPPTSKAGNVLRKSTKVMVSIRLPPTVDSSKAFEICKEKLTTDVPYGAKVTVGHGHMGNGWASKPLAPWLKDGLDSASEAFWGEGQKCRSYGIGGSIPFLFTLGEKFPDTQILAMGVLGPDTSAHNPNELIDLAYA